PETTFFVRLYGSFSKDKYDLLRRGFLTEYPNKYRMVFCDNTFSMLFTGFKLAGVSFTEKDIKELFLQNKLVCSFGLTRNERELSYYSPEGALKVNLNSKGWYLAHINPVGYNFEGKSIKDVFENPDRS